MKILVIDDDQAMTELLKLMLEPTEARVITSNSGASGLQKFNEFKPDIDVSRQSLCRMAV